MVIDLFLWPMLLPLAVPIFYSLRYKKKHLPEILVIALSMSLIVVLWWPVVTSDILGSETYYASKLLLFVLLPLLCLLIFGRKRHALDPRRYGIRKGGLAKSLRFALIVLPIMLVVTYLAWLIPGPVYGADFWLGVAMFFESFTEEFLFRGILFVFLLSRTNVQIAAFTSVACFVLMHPQHLDNISLLPTVTQGILTMEIARRSENIIGAWFLHGINRFFTIAVLPLSVLGTA